MVASAFFIFSQPSPRRPGEYDAVRILDHQALVAPGAGVDEGRLERVGVGRRRSGASGRTGRRPTASGRSSASSLPRRSVSGSRSSGSTGVVAARPERERVEGDVDDRDLGLDRGRRRLAPEPRLERDERQDRSVAPAEDLAVEDPVPGQRRRRPSTISG